MRNGGAAHKNIEAPRICMGRCPRVCGWRVSRLRFPNIDRWAANDKDFSLALEMTIRESREILNKSLSDYTLEFLCIARNSLTRIASYLRKVMTKPCIKILVKSDSAI